MLASHPSHQASDQPIKQTTNQANNQPSNQPSQAKPNQPKSQVFQYTRTGCPDRPHCPYCHLEHRETRHRLRKSTRDRIKQRAARFGRKCLSWREKCLVCAWLVLVGMIMISLVEIRVSMCYLKDNFYPYHLF